MNHKIPNSLNEAINILFEKLSAEDIKFIMENENSSIHLTVGMSIRNYWKLWDKTSHINLDIQTRFKISHGDDVSNLIFTGLWAKVRGKDVDQELKAEANKCITHWKRNGLHPLTGKKLNRLHY